MSVVVPPSSTATSSTPTSPSAPTFNGGAPTITINPPAGQGLSSSTIAVLAYGGLLCVVVLIFTLGWVRVLIQLGVQRLSRAYRRFRGIPDPPPPPVPAIRLPSAARRNSTLSHHPQDQPPMSTASTSMHHLAPSSAANMDRRHSTSSHRSSSSILSAASTSAATTRSPHLEPRAMSGPAADVLTHEDLRRLSWLQASLKGHVVLTIEPPRPGEPLVGLDDDLPRYDIGSNNAAATAAAALGGGAPAQDAAEAAEPATLTMPPAGGGGADDDASSSGGSGSMVSADSASPLVPSAPTTAVMTGAAEVEDEHVSEPRPDARS